MTDATYYLPSNWSTELQGRLARVYPDADSIDVLKHFGVDVGNLVRILSVSPIETYVETALGGQIFLQNAWVELVPEDQQEAALSIFELQQTNE